MEASSLGPIINSLSERDFAQSRSQFHTAGVNTENLLLYVPLLQHTMFQNHSPSDNVHLMWVFAYLSDAPSTVLFSGCFVCELNSGSKDSACTCLDLTWGWSTCKSEGVNTWRCGLRPSERPAMLSHEFLINSLVSHAWPCTPTFTLF